MHLRRRIAAVLSIAALALACSDNRAISPELGPKIERQASFLTTTPQVVISQIYGGGGNSGATLKNDFIELFNPGTTAVSLTGWSVQYASATGTSWAITTLSGTIPAGGYYLIQQAQGTGGTVNLPTPNATGTIAMSATAGKVILASTVSALSGACPTSNVIDAVAFNTSTNCTTSTGWDQNPTAALTNTTAALRLENGCTWTGNPAADFVTSGAPSPRNSATAPHLCETAPPVEVASVEVSADATIVIEGRTLQLRARAFAANGDEVSGIIFEWASNPTATATVSSTGLVTGEEPGTAIVSATSPNGKVGTLEITVTEAPPPPPLPPVRFSELHYDNSATNDPGEGIEIEAPAGTDLTGWSVVLYNGNTPYDTRTLSGRIIERCNGRGVMHLAYGPVTNGAIQNGTADGFALIHPTDGVIEFLSYEGIISNPTGAAAGTESTDIGVAESNSTAPGTSLWRNSSGVWQASAPHTFGACNEGDVPPPPPVTLVITEVMGRPAKVSDTNGEWFEVYNPNNNAVDVTGFVIASTTSDRGPESHTIASNVVIPAKGFVVFGNSADQALNGNVPVTYAYGSSITLSNSTPTEQIELRDAAGQTIDLVTYNGLLPTSGRSRYVLDHTEDNTNWNNFNWEESDTQFNGVDFGTPGAGDYGERGPVATITVSANAPYVSTTGSRQFSARARDAQGRVVATPLTWTSSNSAVATVDANGLARGVTVGTTIITATASNGVHGSADLKVLAPGTPAYTTVTAGNVVPPAGYQVRVFYNVFDADGVVVPNVPPGDISWSTSDAVIATVSVELGNRAYMTSYQAGSVRIIATHVPSEATGFMQTNIRPHAVPTTATYRYHLEFGTPTDSDMDDDLLGNRSQFAFSYNALRGSPNWVSWNLNKSQFGSAPRCDCFSQDASLPMPRVHDVDYINSGYSRGHMVQSESRTTTPQENAATFLLSNIVPQAANNNEGPWLKFENYLNNLARDHNKEIYVIAGGQYGASPQTLNKADKVQIPEYTWKVAVILDEGEGLLSINGLQDLQVIAIRIPNLLETTAGIRNDPWENYEVTVDEIEAAVGYDVLAALEDQIEIAVESKTKPPVARVDGPYTQTEGAAVTLSGAASSDPDAGQTLTYSWSFGDGNTGTGTAVTHTYAQDGDYTVTLTVTDPLGLTSTTTTTAAISNEAPTIAAFSGATLLPGETYSANGSFTDPGADPWTATVDYGDGAGAGALTLAGKTFALSHQYNTAGTFTVTVTVTDDDASATQTATVTVLSVDQAFAKAIAAVDLLVSSGKINNGLGNSLRSKIENAQKSFEIGNTAPTVNQLQAVINELDALVSSNRLSEADAAALRDVVTRLIQSISL